VYNGKHVKPRASKIKDRPVKGTPVRNKTEEEPVRSAPEARERVESRRTAERTERVERELNSNVEQQAEKTSKPKKKKKSVGKRIVIILLTILVVIGGMYSFVVFTNNSFVSKWRTIWIETAMSTMTHQWLATAFFPEDMINDVMSNANQANESQFGQSSKWWSSDKDKNDVVQSGDMSKEDFYSVYWELDEATFEKYLAAHPDVLEDGYAGIVIDNLSCSDTSLKTKFGEVIRAINVPDNIIIMKVTGDDFVGALACVKDPSQVIMEKADHYGSYGDQIKTFCDGNVLAINASGFLDDGGVGNGGAIVGSFVLDGKEIGNPAYKTMFFGFKTDNRLYINGTVSNGEEYKWAVQFNPALVINGVSQVKGSNGWGLQPRTCIGQTKEGEFLALIVDGRQVGYSLGATVEECANVLLKHNAYQAANLDGGSSSIMAYQGEIITKTSSPNKLGRFMPNAIVVTHP